MGNYTTIARFEKMSARYHRPSLRHHGGRSASTDAAPRTEAAFSCPSCGDSSVAETECEQCGLRMIRSDRSVRLPQHSARGRNPLIQLFDLVVGMMFLAALMCGALALVSGVSQIAAPLELGTRSQSLEIVQLGLTIFAGAMALVSVGPRGVSGVLGRRLAGFWRRRRMIAVPSMTLRELPDRAETPVRVRARVAVRGDEDADRFSLIDEGGHSVVRVDPGLVVFDRSGAVLALEQDAMVEVVGVGRRRLGAGASYRDTHGAFVFEGATVWVEHAAPSS